MSHSVTGSAGGPAHLTGRALGVLLVLCGAIFLEGIDVAMLNVALPSIRADLGLSTGMLSGVVSAYVLGYGGFMLLGGRAADLLGHRRMFVLWTLTSIALQFGYYGANTWLPSYLVKDLRVDLQRMGWYVAGTYTMMVLSSGRKRD